MTFNDSVEVTALIGVSTFGIVWGIVNWFLVPTFLPNLLLNRSRAST